MEKLSSTKFKQLSNYQQKIITGGESTSTCTSDTYTTDRSGYTELTDKKADTWSDTNTLVRSCTTYLVQK